MSWQYNVPAFIISAVQKEVIATVTCPVFGTRLDSHPPNDERDTVGLIFNGDAPAVCTGIATKWHFCFHIPSTDMFSVFAAEFAVYRRQESSALRDSSNTVYQRVNESVVRVRISGSGPSADCDSADVNMPFTVMEGDIIGACLPGFLRATGTLDIVAYSETHQIYEHQSQSCSLRGPVDLQQWSPTGTGHVMQLYLETSK